MNRKDNSKNIENISEEFLSDDSSSIDDFIKELEAKEKDLHISSEMVIEIDELDFDSGEDEIPDFVKAELSGGSGNSTPPTSAIDVHQTNPANGQDVSALENRVSQLQNHIAKTETERTELVELMRRRQTDFDNFKKRVERERGDTFLSQLSNLANQMLPVLDNLNRAIDSTDSFSGENKQDFQQFYEGIVLVNQQLNEVLADMGVQPIASVGEAFDPYFHEAVATESTDNFPPHTVTAELLRGYRIGDKVVRPAMVKVSSSTTTAPNSADVSEETE